MGSVSAGWWLRATWVLPRPGRSDLRNARRAGLRGGNLVVYILGAKVGTTRPPQSVWVMCRMCGSKLSMPLTMAQVQTHYRAVVICPDCTKRRESVVAFVAPNGDDRDWFLNYGVDINALYDLLAERLRKAGAS